MQGFGNDRERERSRVPTWGCRHRPLELAVGVVLVLAASAGWSRQASAAPRAPKGPAWLASAAAGAQVPAAPTPQEPAGTAAARTGAKAGSPALAEGPSGGGFSHARHRAVPCGSCHLSAQSHGALKVQTHEDCQACHHAATQRVGCATCHGTGELPRTGAVDVPVRTTVDTSVARRVLPFSHGDHGAVACGSCHGAPPAVAPAKACASCHASHHTAARDCLRCHGPEDVQRHPSASVHAGCNGGGCHSDPAVVALPWSRSVCLSRHQDRTRHAVGGDCAACHQVPAVQSARKEVGP